MGDLSPLIKPGNRNHGYASNMSCEIEGYMDGPLNQRARRTEKIFKKSNQNEKKIRGYASNRSRKPDKKG